MTYALLSLSLPLAANGNPRSIPIQRCRSSPWRACFSLPLCPTQVVFSSKDPTDDDNPINIKVCYGSFHYGVSVHHSTFEYFISAPIKEANHQFTIAFHSEITTKGTDSAMCIAVFIWQSYPLYPFILLLNRDEFFSRPTKPAKWWEAEEILGGRDEVVCGTWLACSRSGRLAFLTNVREKDFLPDALSRGDLPVRFLKVTSDFIVLWRDQAKIVSFFIHGCFVPWGVY